MRYLVTYPLGAHFKDHEALLNNEPVPNSELAKEIMEALENNTNMIIPNTFKVYYQLSEDSELLPMQLAILQHPLPPPY